MASKFQFITELYNATLLRVTGDHERWTSFLRAACYNYKCPFDEQILIYAQRPDATAVLELDKWNRQFGRWVNRGASGIAVFDDANGRGRLKYYFDVADTHPSRDARPVPLWRMDAALEDRVMETLESTFGALAEKETLADAVLSASRNAVADHLPDYLRDLRDCRAGSLLEELDDLNVEASYRRALESSIAYMLLTRLSIPADAYLMPEDFSSVYDFNTPATINALGIATSDIAEMGLREISRTVMQARQEQFFAKDSQISYDTAKEAREPDEERSEDDGTHIQDAGRLSAAEPAAAAGAGGPSGQVRGAAPAVSEEAPAGALHQSEDQLSADGASGGDRADGQDDGGADRAADGPDGADEGNRPAALDGSDEQSPAQRGGTGAQRPDLRLTTEEPAEAGSDTLPASVDHSADYRLLDRLRTDCDYFLGAGGRNEKHLWAGHVHAQIAKMRELYDALSEKPEWLTKEAIDSYASRMAPPYLVAAYHHFENGFDDKLDYQTLEEAEAAARGYVDGTMEDDGFAYDGAGVYDQLEQKYLRVFGDYPDEIAQEQAAAFTLESDTSPQNAQASARPPFLDAHLMEALVLDECGKKVGRQEIFNYFQSHKSDEERRAFLKDAYTDAFAEIVVDGVRAGCHKQDDGLLMWEGSYPARTAESVFSWGVVAELTEALMERGEYQIKLGLQNVPVMAEQMTLFGAGGAVPAYEPDETPPPLFSVREVPQAVLDKALYTAGNEPGSAFRVAAFYMRERPEKENVDFLRREFGTENGRGIEHEGRKYAIWFLEDGIHLAQGNSVRSGYARTTVTWERASARILELLNEGAYLSPAELAQARDRALGDMADALLMTARELTQEARDTGLFARTLAIHDQPKGYPELEKDVVAFAKGEGGLAILAQEYHAFLAAYAKDRHITRFRVSEYNTHRIGVVLDGLDCPERSFTARPDFLRQCKMFITQDEIDHFFLDGGVESNLPVYAHFCYPHTPEERQRFIKDFYGEYSGGGCAGYNHTKTRRGLEYERDYEFKKYDAVRLTIPNVVRQYERLIAQKRFPGGEAIAHIPAYEAGQLARTIYHGFYDVPQGIPRPYPEHADFYAAVPLIQTQLADPAKVREMLDALHAVVDATAEDDRYYDSRKKAMKQLSEYAAGTFSLFNHRHDAPQLQPAIKTDLAERAEADGEPIAAGEPEPPLAPPAPEKKERVDAASPLDAGGRNYRITDDVLGAGTPSERYANNVAAIHTLREIESENRTATAEEQEVLARYVGWGGLADCFNERDGRYTELKSLLSETEYTAARESTLTAFYTPPVVIRAIYQALEGMGFARGNILEPACGTGNFLGLLPGSMAASKLYGVELDDISGRIARQLYQRANISVRGYETAAFPDNFFDAAVGNVPFGQFKVADRRYDRLNLPIHEYFMAKTLDKVRPGGVIAFVTSSFTMDKRTSSARRYIAQRAELLGAIRLPDNTFKAAAGTEVTSDILFLQKRDRMVDAAPKWAQLDTDENGIQMNRYFIDHPDMILGEMKLVSGPYGPEPTCAPHRSQDLGALLQNAVRNIRGEITEYSRDDELDGEDRSIEADPSVRNFSYTLVEGQIYYRENSRMNPVEVSKTAEGRIRGMMELRDCVRALLEYQMADVPENEIKEQQAELNRLYDRFTKDYGLINSRGNAIAFDQDSSYFLLCSLEVLDEDRNLKRKADLFTRRTIRSHRPAEQVDTAVEALALSIGEKARVDMAYMGQLTGRDEETLFTDLSGVVFLNPDYTEGVNEKYLPADEYLSGNVRQKLAVAAEKAAHDPRFQANAEALAQVQPAELTASEISVRLGAIWLNPAYIRQFIFETLGTPRSARWSIKVHYAQVTGEWRIEGKTKDRANVKACSTYGTRRANAYEIIEDSLNLKDVRIFDYQYDAEGRKTAVLNKKETAIAQSKQELLKETFTEWLWRDPERRETVCKTYNVLFNSNRPRAYDGSHITFPGMNPEITLRRHQVNAIAHILYGGNTLLAHVVGAGKTFEMVAAAMESKRLGLCQKSLFVVPNHLTEQWASEFLQLYPAANILVATKKDFETKNRKKFCGRIATGDYDAVIIGHSQFEKIPVSTARQRAVLEGQMDEILAGIREAKAEKAENFTIKQMEKTRKGLQLKIDKLNDQSRKDDVVTFEELGIDRLFVDESHAFKNLFLYTKMRNVGGIAQTEAQKSSDLFMKCRCLDELTGGRGIVFATGTPISNSMVELYTIQRYLQMDALREMGLQHFDAWAANFGETVTAIELSPEGTGYRAKTRFAKFYNLPELMSMFKNVADIQTADMLKLPVPEAHYHNIVLPPSEYQKQMVASLAERAEAVRSRQVDSSVDNMLLITNDGRKLALDQRLLNPMLPDDPHSKSAKCAERVFELWQRTAEKRSAQMIFCDLSTPKGDGTFSVYDDIRAKLLELGVPENEIAYIHSAKSETQKKDLFGRVRAGQVRVLLGSTARMGAGTNVQQRLAALHHVDCPWRPSDLQQREGRIIRQGNENPEVDIYSYVTEGTFDAYLYQLVESKQKFIAQIMTSKSPVRSAEDVDEQALSYAEIKALASGNPLIKEKMDLDIEVSRLKLLKSSHLSQRYALEDAISKTYPKEIAEQQARITGYGADLATVTEHTHPNADGFSPMTLAGTTYAEKKEAGAALLALCQNMLTPEAAQVGSYRGLTLELSFDSFGQEYRLTMIGQLRHPVTLGTDVFGNLQRMDNALETLPVKEQTCRERLGELQAQLETAKAEVRQPFPREADLKAKAARLEELNALLNLDHREPEVIDGEPDENARAPARPPAQMER